MESTYRVRPPLESTYSALELNLVLLLDLRLWGAVRCACQQVTFLQGVLLFLGCCMIMLVERLNGVLNQTCACCLLRAREPSIIWARQRTNARRSIRRCT